MSRYDTPDNPETRQEPGGETGVLQNLLGIKTVAEIEEMETALRYNMQERSLEMISSDTRFTTAMIRELHKMWLQPLYSWAGNYRTVNISKAEFSWPPAMHVPMGMEKFEKETLTSCTPCEGAKFDDLVEKITLVHEELLFIHPFREGNGRLGRWITSLMALQAGYQVLNWAETAEGSGRGREEYFAAMRSAHAGKSEALKGIIRRALKEA